MSVFILRHYIGRSASEFREISSMEMDAAVAAELNIAFNSKGLPFRVHGETPRQAELRTAAERKDFEEVERIRRIVKIVLSELSSGPIDHPAF